MIPVEMSLVPVRPKVSIEGIIAVHIINRMGIMWKKHFTTDFLFKEFSSYKSPEYTIVYDDMSRIFDNPEAMELLRKFARDRKN